MLTQAEFIANTKTLEETCPIHGIPLMQLDRVVKIAEEDKPRKLSPICPECIKEQNEKQVQEEVEKHLNAGIYQKTYNVLMRDSTIPEDLKAASFDNFIIETPEEKQMLDFVKNQTQKYLDGMNGNTLLTGTTGVGKTHLAISLAKELNEAYRAKGEPKSVLFINLTEILREIRESFKFTSKEGYYSRMLKEVDYLILDDLGVKLGNSSGQSKSAWEEEFIFDVLSHRKNTIITTNLSNDEIANLYSERVASRVRTGLEENYFKIFSIKDKRYSINKLKSSM
ncbi:ATP-binding protein [Streptococcus suis]|uniref:ATP-binding protein n=1 Tax=Streptococcus suis TaxID=1307 RepID=UPI00032A4618|nr:ATP-binding protein [Streptococcus suis]QBX11614.1 DNA replication protein [Streptococcus satellite phage Javan595]AGL48245.1 Helicase loader DnaI [Streptococcus suis TL13]MBY4959096.1 ATP-binding protein [Streptococcus suis]MBY5027234.1 ATP-binding protein [Streptococcus suis]MBY6287534.1 ATP-binding protein [Streptococcus suis]